MMCRCKLCGKEFDHEEAEIIDCNCGCGGDNVLCLNCGYEVRLPREYRLQRPKLKKEDTLFTKVRRIFQMGN